MTYSNTIIILKLHLFFAGNEIFLLTHNFERVIVSLATYISSESALLNLYKDELHYLDDEDGGIYCRHYNKDGGNFMVKSKR